MNFNRILFCLIAALLLHAPGALAREWSILGPRALGMGGAGVAVANDATASYWNPAAYGFFKTRSGDDYGRRDWSTVIGAGAGVAAHEDIGDVINKIIAFDYSLLSTGQITADRVPDFLQLIDELKGFKDNPNRAVTVNANALFALQYGHFGIGGYLLGDLSARGDLDLVNIAPVSSGSTGIDLITQLSTGGNFNGGSAVPAGDFFFTSAEKLNLVNTISAINGWNTTTATDYVQAVDFGLSTAQTGGQTIPADITNDITSVAQLAGDAGTGGSFADNTSRLLFKGIAFVEVPFTYGVALTKNIAVGTNLKYMRARVYNTPVQVFNIDLADAIETAKNEYKESQNFGVDVGVLVRIGETFRFGVVGRNLNSPEFDMKALLADDKDHLTEQAQVRAGLAVKPTDSITLALDVDLTKNDTTVSSSYKSQVVAGGLELNILNSLKLRGGAYKNLAETDMGVVYTAGLGFSIAVLNIDIGVALSSEGTSFDDHDIPKEVKAEAALTVLF